MGNQLSSLLIVLFVIAMLCYGWVAFPPYYFHDMLPNEPMQVVIGNKAWYFPMDYMEPHYPNGAYKRGAETEVWLTLGVVTGKILPQNTADRPIGETYDAILSSDNNPQTKKAMAELNALKKDIGTFAVTEDGMRMKQVGNETEYLDIQSKGDTRISCQDGQCALFTTQIPDIRTAMVFADHYLPQWQKRLDLLAANIQPYRFKPPWTYYVTSLASLHPSGIEADSVVPETPALHTPEPIPIEPIPTMNKKSAEPVALPTLHVK